MTSKNRIQIDLTDVEMERLREVMDQCGHETRKDLFRDAMSLLEWAVKEVQHGFKIISADEGKDKQSEVANNALQNAIRRATHGR